jgi:conjugative transposon TraM protein
MNKINFKQPKYVLPLLALPFLCLFFYVYHSSMAPKKPEKAEVSGINGTVGEVSGDIKKKALSDKLDAYRNTYKEADGFTAVSPISPEQTSNATYNNDYSDKQKLMLDSINKAMKQKFASGGAVPHEPTGGNDRALADALNGISKRRKEQASKQEEPPPKEKDPMVAFKQQIAFMDSLNKANDPEVKAERLKKEALAKALALHSQEKVLQVKRADDNSADFNTLMPEKKDAFIMAIIDENVTGYAGSRIRLRLLEDIKAGSTVIKKGTYLYALINGFFGQRVTFEVRSVLVDGKILPVKLDIYDLDGMAGLYVPESAFREFTKELGGNSIQGVTIDGSSGSGNQLLMSSASKIFQSTSSAIADAIRKNKAKIKYNSYIYLIDNQALQNAANSN